MISTNTKKGGSRSSGEVFSEPMTFARALKSWRLTEELSQGDLANKTGLTKAAISRFESGKDFPTADTLRLLTDALDASFQMFSVYIVQDIAEKKGFHGLEVKPIKAS